MYLQIVLIFINNSHYSQSCTILMTDESNEKGCEIIR